jgi:hypothetical protein
MAGPNIGAADGVPRTQSLNDGILRVEELDDGIERSFDAADYVELDAHTPDDLRERERGVPADESDDDDDDN